jgi:type VI secretion system protein ImpL
MNFSLAIVGSLAAYFAFVWLATALLKLTGIDLWFVRGLLWMVGLSGGGLFLWWRKRRRKTTAEPGADAGAGGGDEIDLLIRDAEARLAGSNLGKLANLPVFLVLGPPGAAKTNTVLHSGLEPELLAGQIYQDNAVLPTRSANLWFARGNVVVEAGGKLVGDPARWQRLIKKLEPRRLTTALGKGETAPRAAVVCFDVEDFLRSGAADNLAIGVRQLHARLGEISQVLGISLPVYVLFTKADRMPFFLDYVRNLSADESTQVVGATLPVEPAQATGVWAERAIQRLSAAFDDLFYSLSDKRLDFLAREHAGEKLPGIYEFPREFRKLRTSLAQFLVDLSKPSQLRAAPFLRGFYFSGVRPVVVADVSRPAAPQAAEPGSFAHRAGATGLFHSAQPRPVEAPQPQVIGSRRVPQWVFLSHFWNDILLADRAVASSGASVGTNRLRRVLLATAAGLCLLYSLALVVSYVRNSRLEGRVLDASRALSAVPPAGQELPSLDSLKRLEALRAELATLAGYERDGAPFSLRWGLYTGSELYPEAYRLYFGRLHSLLFGWTQASMLDSLRRLPAAPAPTDEYGPPYNTLKAYLITTSEWRRSTRAFLSPYLLKRWSENRGVDPERMQLTQRQFDFYSDELRLKNPYSDQNEAPSIERARAYLKQFNADARIYQSLLDEVSRRTPSINFNRLFPNPAVSDSREVRGAFTKDGWKFMEAAFRKPEQLFGGEDWVLGPQSYANLDRAQLEQRLRAFYYRDFIQEWREFIKAGAVSRYASFADAASKLDLISSNSSPLLALFCLVSQHTAVDAPEIRAAFQAPQQVVPPACLTQYIQAPNQPYMQALVQLGGPLKQVAASASPATDPAAAQTRQQAQQALLVTAQVAMGFAIDKDGSVDRVTRKLMEDPITQVDRLLSGFGLGELRDKGRALCGQFHALMAKYPFNLRSQVQATLDDVNAFFRPTDGALPKFVSQSLQPLVEKQGSQYVSKSGGAMTITPGFLAFLNRGMAFSDAAYAGGAQQPRLNYTLKSDLTNVNQNITLTLDGQTLTNSTGKVVSKPFVWPGNPSGTTMQVKFGGEPFNWPRFDGLWGTFEFFGDAEERGGQLEWTLKTGQSQRQVTTAGGQPVLVRFGLEMSPPVFRKGYFSGWACTADVAR